MAGEDGFILPLEVSVLPLFKDAIDLLADVVAEHHAESPSQEAIDAAVAAYETKIGEISSLLTELASYVLIQED